MHKTVWSDDCVVSQTSWPISPDPHRTQWEVALTSPSPSRGSYLTCSSGPGSWQLMRSTARRPAGTTSLVMSCPGLRNQWSFTEASPSSHLSHATKDWRWTYCMTPWGAAALSSPSLFDDASLSKLAGELGNFNLSLMKRWWNDLFQCLLWIFIISV